MRCPHCGTSLRLSLVVTTGDAQDDAQMARNDAQIVEVRSDAQTSVPKSSKPQTKGKKPLPEVFLRFWEAYPLKKDRLRTYAQWQRAMRNGADPEIVIAAAKRYAADSNRDPRYTKYPATWLSAGSYEDEDPLPGKLAPAKDPEEQEWAIQEEIARFVEGK